MSLAALAQAAGAEHLDLIGALHQDGRTVALLGPSGGPGFWTHFTGSAEYGDGRPDPLERWSKRVIGELARTRGGVAVLPSDGPPYPPFVDWALASGACHRSPVGLLVDARAGLWLSFRGAILLGGLLELPPAHAPSPCTRCPQRPCQRACPAAAMSADRGYDLPACHRWLDRPEGSDCLQAGCLVRRACPAGARHGRLAAQSAFHMKAFHP